MCGFRKYMSFLLNFAGDLKLLKKYDFIYFLKKHKYELIAPESLRIEKVQANLPFLLPPQTTYPPTCIVRELLVTSTSFCHGSLSESDFMGRKKYVYYKLSRKIWITNATHLT